MQKTLPLLLSLCLLGTAHSAHALDIYGVDLKVGLRGGGGVNWLPNAVDFSDGDRERAYDTFIGGAGGIGISMQIRALDIIGLEIGWLRTFDSATATMTIEGISAATCQEVSCAAAEVGATMRNQADHIPILLQVSLPSGMARPFANIGLDLVVNRRARALELTERATWPENLDPAQDGATIDAWDESVEARYLFDADVTRSDNDVYAGIVGGIGVNIVIKNFEIPIELRTNWYPSAGDTIDERGVFVPSESAYDPRIQSTYNDRWFAQGLVLIGFDYVIF
ncbi:MAG: hypothetical protein ACJAYU_003207 [Bradymonadia bacterium]|jgi:hypothetical protein